MASDRHRVFVGARPMVIMRHAVERYVERVKSALEYRDALVELERMLRLVEATRERPAWAGGQRIEDEWVELCDGIAFPVVAGCLVTCITRASVGAELRIVNGEDRRQRRERASRLGTKKKHGKVAREERVSRARRRAELADG